MLKYCTLGLILLLTGCGLLRWEQATPTSVVEDVALQRFLTRAPLPVRATPVPTPDEPTLYVAPRGLPLPLVDPLDVVGDLTTTGSPALARLTRLLYARFVSDGYRDMMRIEEVDTDVAFQRYCAQAAATQGAIDLVMADRPITQGELEACQQQKRQPVALRVALSAAVLAVNPAAAFLPTMNKVELMALFTAKRWSDIHPSWPDVEIVRVAPPLDSAIDQLFVDKVLQRNRALLQNAPAVTFLADGQEIVFMLIDTPFAIGLLDFADYQKNRDKLRLVAFDGIHPNGSNVSRGAYALTYPLLLYTDLATLEAKPQVGAFLLYYLATMNEEIGKAGNFSVNEASYERAKVVLLNALGQKSYLGQFAPTSTPAPPAIARPTPSAPLTAAALLTTTVTVTR